MPWLWGYCPRSIVARLGQHNESVTYALVKVVPLPAMMLRSPFRYCIERLSRSSVRTKTMLGCSAAVADFIDPIAATNTTAIAMKIAAAIEASSRTAFPMPVIPLGAKDEVGKYPRPVAGLS